jgi:hypothetical protein
MGPVSSAYWRRLEVLLALSARAYDPRFPLVCFEERPCLLLGDVVEGLAPPPGRAAKEPYAYRKQGACCVLAAIAPLTGRRLYQVRGQRTKRAYTPFRQRRAAHYPDAEKIRLGQDNLNTHLLRTFYDWLPAALARKLAERFEVCYPPKAASWLNRIELDFSALARQCLQRRIPTQAQLAYQVYCSSRQRQQQEVKIRWQFPPEQARQTLHSQYGKVNKANKKYANASSTQ